MGDRGINAMKLDVLVTFINSQFFSSMSGALAGALAGAIAAHRISTSAKRREEVEAQIRAVNTAIMSAFLICNSLLSLKKQQIAKMHKTFTRERTRYEASLTAPAGSGPFRFEMDLEFMNLPLVPIEVLTKQAYEKLNLRGRPLALVSAISGSLALLQTRVALRNSLIERFRSEFHFLQQEEKLNIYFGLPLSDGSLSKEYADCMEGINDYANDVIYFASLLCSDLGEYGNTIRDEYIKKHGKKVEKINVMIFDKPEAKALMPASENYADWQNMFGALPETQKKPWYKRLF